mmetsp:Transcript_55626/g.63135  ORF Transcript_55626/g.63135 Transcript_55626/m.63135 type:complete len:420 (-) Transcript_55626:119-1378(-)
MFRRILITLALSILLVTTAAYHYCSLPIFSALVIVTLSCIRHLHRDRWAVLRTHPCSPIRKLCQYMAIYRFAYRLDVAVAALPAPLDATQPESYADAVSALDEILSAADCPDTFQRKESNVLQIQRLAGNVCDLVDELYLREAVRCDECETAINAINGDNNRKKSNAQPLVLDIGAGKALFTRTIYETLHRNVPCVAFDRRKQSEADVFYDPLDGVDDNSNASNGKEQEQPYTRLVGDVGRLSSSRNLQPLHKSRGGGLVAVTKHLCGGATDNSLMALCRPPLSEYVGGACLAPCCHQKTRREQYCNLPYLQTLGLCRQHRGLRGAMQDADFRTLGLVISMSKAKSGLSTYRHDYKHSVLLQLLGFDRAAELGRKARRVLEEGRAEYLRQHGFEATIVQYCDGAVTSDNLAIIAKKKRF